MGVPEDVFLLVHLVGADDRGRLLDVDVSHLEFDVAGRVFKGRPRYVHRIIAGRKILEGPRGRRQRIGALSNETITQETDVRKPMRSRPRQRKAGVSIVNNLCEILHVRGPRHEVAFVIVVITEEAIGFQAIMLADGRSAALAIACLVIQPSRNA